MYIIGLLLALLLLLAALINVPAVQDYLVKQSASYLSKKLKTKVEVQGLQVSFLDKAVLKGLYIEDQKGDTLLYAGNAKVNITDWFIFKDNPVLTYLGLEDAWVYLKRPARDSVWNYEFALDAFTFNDNKQPKNKNDFQLDFQKLHLRNVHFSTIDKWLGSDMEIDVPAFEADFKGIDYRKKSIALHTIYGDGVVIGLRDYKATRPDNLKPKYSGVIDTTPFNPQKWTVNVDKLDLKNSRFFMDDPDRITAPVGLFDEWKMDIRNINLLAHKINIIGDTLRADMKLLTAQERSGIHIKKMQALVTVSPKISECKNLYLETNNSVIRDYYAMHYDRFPDFEDYISKVRMEGHLRQSKVAINDIIFFAPEMQIFKDMVVLANGDCGGTVDNLYATNTILNDGKSQLRVGKFAMDKLPDVDNSIIKIERANIATHSTALFQYFPFLQKEKSLNFFALQHIDADFDFNGTIHNFNINTQAKTALGSAFVKLNMQQVMSPLPYYSGYFQTSKFNIGTFLNQKDFGWASGSFNFKGSSFDAEKISVFADGHLSALDWRGYAYQNLKVKGTFSPQIFEGDVVVNDPNAIVNFSGIVGNKGKVPEFNFNAVVSKLNLKNLKLSDEDLHGNAIISGHFKGSTIDDFIGSASIKDMLLMRDTSRLNLSEFALNAGYEGHQRVLTVDANNLKAKIWGDYALAALPSSFQQLLSKYFPNYIKSPQKYLNNQDIHFEIQSQNINDLISIFNKDIQMPYGGNIIGFINTASTTMQLDAAVPRFVYSGIAFDSVKIKGDGDANAMDINLQLHQILSATTTLFKKLQFNSKIFRDSLRFDLVTTTADDFGKAYLNGVGHAFDSMFVLNILPSEIILNKNRWEIPKGNAIVLERDKINISKLNIISDLQQIIVNDDPAQVSDNELKITLRNLNIAPLTRFYKVDNVILGGNVNGSINVQSLLENQKINFDLASKDIRFYGDTLGTVSLIGNYDVAKNLISLAPKSGISSGDAYANVSGKLALDTVSSQSIDGKIEFRNAHVSWLAPVLKGFVNNLKGTIDGNINITGSADNPATQGKLQLKNIEVRPDINGETYKIANTTVGVSDKNIDIGILRFQDSEGNDGIITGSITHKRLSQFYFNLSMFSDRLRILNLSASEGGNFYGNILAHTQIYLFGSEKDLNVHISATPLPNSDLVIPIDFSSDLGKYNFIRFKKNTDTAIVAKKKLKLNNKYNIRIDAVVNQNLKSNIILDPATGDQLISTGNGNIVLEIPSDGDMRLNGNYKIEEGTYNFAFRQMQILNYRRQFNIIPGSTIVWNGSLYDANLDVSAFAPIKTRLYDLISSEVNRINLSQQEKSDAQIAQMVHVMLYLKGTLQKPDLNFKIELAENRSIGTYAYQKLERINNDEKQLLNQVASLLLLEQFAPPDGFMNTAAMSSGTINNMSDVLSAVASSQLTNFASKLFKVQDLHIGIGYKNYNLSNSTDPEDLALLNRNEAKFNVRKNFLNNRLLVDVGGVYDWGRPVGLGQRTSNLAGDFRLQYLITKDGRIRFNIFRNTSYDAIFQQNISRQGVGLSYRKSFNNIFDLLGFKPKLTLDVFPDTSKPIVVPVIIIGKQKDSVQ